MNGPPNGYYTQPSAAPQGPAWPAQGYAHPPHGYDPAPPHPYQQPHIAAGPSNAPLEFHHWQHPPVQPGSTAASSSAVDGTASAEPRKRRSRQPATRKRRRPNLTPTENGSMPGKYSPYTLANASAAVMVMPVHDPKPVDISKRKTLDPHGNPLRTRRFGVMELDDSYPSTPDNLMNLKGLSPELTCVRSCDWTDQPCGLFIEMDKTSIDGHLWYWHGLKTKTATPCQFEGCEDTEDMKYWGRHIEGVHFETSYQCPYCNKHLSRDDALRRHLKGCTPFADIKEHAQRGGHEFCAQAITKLVQGYIVPAASAT
ncbi:hypothetical protein EV702DRAFT_1084738 [Suillus placidus]|uniref:C2H2-type domain-containing protein n=1 Tax=Suillus placidus TaxID=48579 RepID=A0A9P7A277_9AGAM|nr:hypothetical protein EV702DRAFT_1084738 [Suillus placidus]